MKLLMSILFFVVFFSSSVFSQITCPILQNIESIIRIEAHEIEGKTYISNRIEEVSNILPFAQLINDKKLFWDYLTVNYSDRSHVQKIAQIMDSVERATVYYESLRNDSLFTITIKEYSNKVIHKSIPKDTVKMSDLLGVAAKFFSIQSINDQGNFSTAICVGRNDIKKTEVQKRPLLEAFAFFAIFEDLETEKFNIYQQFHQKVKELYSISLGTTNEEKLLRAQGAIYMLMIYNSNLRELLTYHFERHKEGLSFVLVD